MPRRRPPRHRLIDLVDEKESLRLFAHFSPINFIQAIADDAQRDLDEALPALAEAVQCLKDLKKADIDEVMFSLAPAFRRFKSSLLSVIFPYSFQSGQIFGETACQCSEDSYCLLFDVWYKARKSK